MKTAQMSTDTPALRAPRLAKLSLLIGALFSGPLAHGGVTDISNTPLANTSDISAKPNIMFVIDNSGSMAWSFMPDDLGQTSQGQTASDATALGRYGGLSAQCNGVAYNPKFNYTQNRPLQPDGTIYPNASFSAVMDDGFQMNLTGTKVSSSTSTVMGTGDKVFTVSGTPYSTTVGAIIGIVSTTDSTRWMMGTIKTWNSGSKQLTVTVNSYVGSGTYATWSLGNPGTTDLGGSVYYTYKGTQPALSWTFSATTLWHTVNTFSNECLSTIGNSPGSSVFTSVTVNSTSSEAQNYANWYAYYRKRFLMMRTVSGQALNGLSNNYRVGFTAISNSGVTSNGTFLDIADFDSTQKATFYSRFYNTDVSGSTPLRGALSKVGRYFAKKMPGQTYDPIQYACQRNYTLLSTDGYWNTGGESSTYTSLKLDGVTAVGQQDGGEDKPMWDGQMSKVTKTTPYSTVIHQTATYVRTTKNNVSRNSYTLVSTGCTGSQKKLGTQVQTATETILQNMVDTQDVTGTTTQTIITLGGVSQAPTYSTPNATGTPTVLTSNGTVTSDTYSSWTNSGSVTYGSCSAGAALPSPNPSTAVVTSVQSVSDGTKTVTTNSQSPVAATGASSTTTGTQGGASDTLADIAEYYYVTDLRTSALGNCTGALGTDVCDNEVPPGDHDKASWQHMTTFTMGLGVGGILTYDRNYLTQTSGDYNNLKQGTITWPIPSVGGGGDPTNVDDLWHTAVNGRGQYFATTDPTSLADAITTVLTSVQKATGSSSSAATSSLKPIAGQNNQVFVAMYTTVDWTGDLLAYTLNTSTGAVDTKNPVWSAQSKGDVFGQVDALTSKGNWLSRTVYYMQPNASVPTLHTFDYTTLNGDGYGTYFTNVCSKPTIPAQCAGLTTTQKSLANSGTNLVNFLRGDRTYENYNDTSGTTPVSVTIYRNRAHLLGDIVNASPIYVGTPPFKYADPGYADFVKAKASRKPVVYVAANDGMLHAISADKSDGGNELWSYVPSFVMSNLYLLADTNYSNNHHFYVDGSPIVADIYVNKAWKTILIGGLNDGGKGYYALDVTDPLSPKALWEFTDTNLGYTYAPPIVTKKADGTWVAVFSSGYNNVGGDGNGHLYVVNANTGVSVLSSDIATFVSSGVPAGTAASPSGLGKLNAWIEDVTDNTSLRFYGGDLLGNLWRFDIDGLTDPKKSAFLLANFTKGGVPQPITTRPETVEILTYPVVMVGTGRYLGTSDIVDKSTQSIYAIKDTLTATGWGNVRGRSDLVMQTMTDAVSKAGAKIRTSTNYPVNWANQIGWGVDLISSGERVAVDMSLQYTTLAVVSAIPGVDECKPSGGSSWFYNFSIFSGAAPSSAADGAVGNYLGGFLGVGLTWIELPDGSSRVLIPGSDGSFTSSTPAIESGSSSTGTAHTTSWRELF